VIKGWGTTPERAAASLGPIALRIDGVLRKLPDTFVADGGTDLKDPDISDRGKITTFAFSDEVAKEDPYLFTSIISYILKAIVKSFGWLSPDATRLVKDIKGGGVHNLIILEEAAQYLKKGMAAAIDAAKLAELGAKYGIQALYIFQTMGDLQPEVTGNIDLLRLFFVPEPEEEQKVLDWFPMDTRDNVRKAFGYVRSEKSPAGVAVIKGAGTDAEPWALVHIVPKRTSSVPFISLEEWRAWRSKQKEKMLRERAAIEKEAESKEGKIESLIEEMKKYVEK
jgi:hypothetical protein